MKYKICIKYPSGYRYRKEIDAEGRESAMDEAEKMCEKCNEGFGVDQACKVEYVGEVTDTEKAIKHFENVAADYYNRLDDEANQEVYDMCGVALSALHAQQERENPKPLTLEQLKERVGMPVWIAMGGYGSPQCRVLVKYFDDINIDAKRFLFTDGTILHCEAYGDWTAYDHMPKEAE